MSTSAQPVPAFSADCKPVETFQTEPPACPFRRCDMASNHQVVERGWDFEYHTTRCEIDMMQCRDCKVIFPRGIPNAQAMPVLYPPTYYSFTETANPNRIVRAIRNWVARRKGSFYQGLVNKESADVVEVGCGDGRLLDALKYSCPPAWRYAGIDWSPQAIERLQARGYEGRSGDLADIDLSDWAGRFDLVIMQQLIEHVRDPRRILEKIGTILKPGGILSIETPDIKAWDYYCFRSRYWAGYHIPRHFYIFNKINFVQLAAELGYDIVRVRSLINPVAWIHSIKSYCADKPRLARFARLFHHQNVVLLSLFTPIELVQSRLFGTSSNMQVNLRKR
jgi:SAM-dependent methyltransferase